MDPVTNANLNAGWVKVASAGSEEDWVDPVLVGKLNWSLTNHKFESLCSVELFKAPEAELCWFQW